MPDGGLSRVPPRIGTWSEAWRHECEVRYVRTMTPERRIEFCKGVEKHRGRAAAERLWREAAK